MLRMRLRRTGAKKQPRYRVVVMESQSKRDGAFVDWLGFYDPLTNPPTVRVNEERVRHWLSKGVSMSDTVRGLLRRTGFEDVAAARIAVAVAPGPLAEVASPEPATETASPEPTAEAASSEPSAEAASPEPTAEAASSEPSPEAASQEPSAEATDDKPGTEEPDAPARRTRARKQE